MYYNEIIQPDGRSVIGVNHNLERPNVLEVLSTDESRQVQEPEYKLFESIAVYWVCVFLVLGSVHYVIMYDNLQTILNCLACLLPMHSLQNNSMYGMFAYTIYVMIAM